MADEKRTLDDLKDMVEGAAAQAEGGSDAPAVAPPAPEAIAVEPEIDSLGRAYATGKRKNAVARVWIKPGSGRVMVNGRDQEVYFARPVLRMILRQPFEAADRNNQYDAVCTVSGGGLSGQAGAVRHGISWALIRAAAAQAGRLPDARYSVRRRLAIVAADALGRGRAVAGARPWLAWRRSRQRPR